MRTRRVYCDTSVFGGCFDVEFAEASNRLMDLVRQGAFQLVISQVTLDELVKAPENVRELVDSLPGDRVETLEEDPEVSVLRDAYLAARVVGPSSRADAEHIASATIAGVDMIVSWNFRHIVHFRKIPLYNAVNALRGYPSLSILSPREVIEYEDEDV